MCSPSAPTQQQMATTELPEWARPYAQKALAKTEALTETPLAKYTEPRIAGFSPLQQAAMSTVESPETYGRSIGAFMSPYMQNVVDVQKREAARQSAMMGTQQQAQATGAGAFGGYREALQRAERERNLGQQMNDIQTRGLEAAYQGAQGTLGNFLGLQSQYGAQQQALRQQGLSQAYQDFMNEQNYPYKQLGFMSDMIRGLPLGQQSTSQIYQAPPTALQTVGSLGLGAYGLKQLGMFADGGMVGYADGGSVTSEEFVQSALSKLSDTQLAQAERVAIMTNDQQRLQDIAEEKATRASERGGMAGAFNALSPAMQQRMLAGGGIVAFAEGGIQRYNQKGYVMSDTPGYAQGDDSELYIPLEDLGLGKEDESKGDPDLYRQYGEEGLQSLARLKGMGEYKPTSAKDRAALRKAYLEQIQADAGPSPYGQFEKYIAEAEAARPQALQEAKGLGALRAMQAITQPGGFIRGLGGAGAAFGETLGRAKEADRAEKRALASMQLNLADAQRKERMGMTKQAEDAVARAEQDRREAYNAGVRRESAVATAATRGATAYRPTAQKGASQPKLNEQLAAAEIAFETNPTEGNLKNVTALRRAVAQAKTTDVGGTRASIEQARIQSAEDARVLEARSKAQYTPAYVEAKTPEAKRAVLQQAENEARQVFRSQNRVGNDGVIKLD